MGRTKKDPRVKLNGYLTRKVVNRIKKWVPKSVVCAEAGISVATYDRWMLRGETGEHPYADFYKAVSRAYAERIEEGVEQVKSERGGYRWLLEKLHPDEFGKTPQVIEVGHRSLPGEIIMDAEVLTADVDRLLGVGNGEAETSEHDTGVGLRDGVCEIEDPDGSQGVPD